MPYTYQIQKIPFPRLLVPLLPFAENLFCGMCCRFLDELLSTEFGFILGSSVFTVAIGCNSCSSHKSTYHCNDNNYEPSGHSSRIIFINLLNIIL